MIEVDGRHSLHEVPFLDKNDFYCPDDFDKFNFYPCDVLVKTEIYRKIEWQSGDKNDFTFFALENLSNYEVMHMILNNYQPFKQFEENKKFKRYEIMLERCVKMLDEFMRSPFPSNQLMKNVYDLIYDVKKFLFNETNKN